MLANEIPIKSEGGGIFLWNPLAIVAVASVICVLCIFTSSSTCTSWFTITELHHQGTSPSWNYTIKELHNQGTSPSSNIAIKEFRRQGTPPSGNFAVKELRHQWTSPSMNSTIKEIHHQETSPSKNFTIKELHHRPVFVCFFFFVSIKVICVSLQWIMFILPSIVTLWGFRTWSCQKRM